MLYQHIHYRFDVLIKLKTIHIHVCVSLWDDVWPMCHCKFVFWWLKTLCNVIIKPGGKTGTGDGDIFQLLFFQIGLRQCEGN